jgi:hypothetical protein
MDLTNTSWEEEFKKLVNFLESITHDEAITLDFASRLIALLKCYRPQETTERGNKQTVHWAHACNQGSKMSEPVNQCFSTAGIGTWRTSYLEIFLTH